MNIVARVALGLFTALSVGAIGTLLYIRFNGGTVPVPDIPRSSPPFGKGPPLKLVVLGDSTAVGQGAAYADGIAIAARDHLAKNYTVTLENYGVSGARTHDVAIRQVPQAIAAVPDIVIIAVGANDVTHATRSSSVRTDTEHIIRELQTHCVPRIVITGAAAMQSVPRFPPHVQAIAGYRTDQLNMIYTAVARSAPGVTLAPVAERTGAAFAEHPEWFAADKFHPNAQGYAAWNAVITDALDASLQKPDAPCKTTLSI